MLILLTASPCTSRCKLDADKQRCQGCGRSRQEIKSWKSADDSWRHNVNVRLLATQGKKVRKQILRDVPLDG
jgi:predicted Fe-S protein YdhL (DUF1289 family)